jgi:hypothetical protein
LHDAGRLVGVVANNLACFAACAIPPTPEIFNKKGLLLLIFRIGKRRNYLEYFLLFFMGSSVFI